MAGQTQNGAWHRGFFTAIVPSLKDIRLWFIVLPALVICGITLVLLKPAWLAAAISFALALVMARLINNIETFPRPDEKQLAESLYRNVLLPAAAGMLIIPSMPLFAELWAMQWHWFHGSGAIPPCSYVWIVSILGWVGVLVVPVVTALLTKERAVFATVVGLIVYAPLAFTMAVSADSILKLTSILVKSCQMDADDFDASAFSIGTVTGILLQVLVAIFVAKVVSTWLSRRNAARTTI